MTEIIIISAVSLNGVIGNKTKIPWYISEDFKRFKRLTMGFPCIMGDVTYNSLPEKSRPLPGRENIVLSLNPDYKSDNGVVLFNDFNKAIDYIKFSEYKKAYIIGGSQIYKLGIQIADTLEITRVNKSFEGDAFFPEIGNDWELISEVYNKGYEIDFTYQTYKRIK